MRHVGLLRSLLLKEMSTAAVAAATTKTTATTTVAIVRSDALSGQGVGSDGLPVDINVPSAEPSDQSQAAFIDPTLSPLLPCPSTPTSGATEVEDSSPPNIEATSVVDGAVGFEGYTSALLSLQSELFLEALCRTLKVHLFYAACTRLYSFSLLLYDLNRVSCSMTLSCT